MALPKKRKKLSNSGNSSPAENVSSPVMNKEKKEPPKSRSRSTARKKSGEKMNKAFEIIEQIENNNSLPEPDMFSDRPSDGVKSADEVRTEPGRIQFRISLDPSITGANKNPENMTVNYDKPHVVDFGFTIPSFVLKVPFLKKAARKMIRKLTSQN